MANNCYYALKAVANNEEALKRLVRIMKYEDEEFFIYRCFQAIEGEIKKEDNGLFSIEIEGDVAWSCAKWFDHEEDKNELAENNAHYITLDLLCEKFNIGIELWSQECGCEFQEHYVVNHKGEILIDDNVYWSYIYKDEKGNELDEPIEKGGFEGWGKFDNENAIYTGIVKWTIPEK